MSPSPMYHPSDKPDSLDVPIATHQLLGQGWDGSNVRRLHSDYHTGTVSVRVCVCDTLFEVNAWLGSAVNLHLSGQLQKQWSRIRWGLLTWFTLILLCCFQSHKIHKVISQLFHETSAVEKWSSNEECSDVKLIWLCLCLLWIKRREITECQVSTVSRYLVNCHGVIIWSPLCWPCPTYYQR